MAYGPDRLQQPRSTYAAEFKGAELKGVEYDWDADRPALGRHGGTAPRPSRNLPGTAQRAELSGG